MQPNNVVIQSTSVDLLQAIVTRGEVDPVTVEVIEALVVGKLYFCIHRARLDLQNKLLHLLHSLIFASTTGNDPPSSGKQRQGDGSVEGTSDSQEAAPRAYPVNPLLIQTLVDGIATPMNRPVLQHWLDFVLMAVPQFQPTLQAVVTPLNECLCKQVLASLGDILNVTFKDGLFTDDLTSSATDAELIMLLGGLERLVLLSLAYPADSSSSEDEQAPTEKAPENSGLLGYVSTVFSSENVQNFGEEQLTVRYFTNEKTVQSNGLSRLSLLDIDLCTKASAFYTWFGRHYCGPTERPGLPKTIVYPSFILEQDYGVGESWNTSSAYNQQRSLNLSSIAGIENFRYGMGRLILCVSTDTRIGVGGTVRTGIRAGRCPHRQRPERRAYDLRKYHMSHLGCFRKDQETGH